MTRCALFTVLFTAFPAVLAQGNGAARAQKSSHGFEQSPVKVIGMDACAFVIKGGACSDFVAENRDMIASHEKMHEITGADSLLCYTVEGVLTESKQYKEFSETKMKTAQGEELERLMESFCKENFDETGIGYLHLKHHYVRNVPYGKADV